MIRGCGGLAAAELGPASGSSGMTRGIASAGAGGLEARHRLPRRQRPARSLGGWPAAKRLDGPRLGDHAGQVSRRHSTCAIAAGRRSSTAGRRCTRPLEPAADTATIVATRSARRSPASARIAASARSTCAVPCADSPGQAELEFQIALVVNVSIALLMCQASCVGSEMIRLRFSKASN